MSMLPEIAKNLGPDGVIIALIVMAAGGGSAAYLFWRVVSQILTNYTDLIQAMRKDYRVLARDQRDAYERGRHDGERDEPRTPSEGTRVGKE